MDDIVKAMEAVLRDEFPEAESTTINAAVHRLLALIAAWTVPGEQN